MRQIGLLQMHSFVMELMELNEQHEQCEQHDLQVHQLLVDEYRVECFIYSIHEVPAQEYGHEEMSNEPREHNESRVYRE